MTSPLNQAKLTQIFQEGEKANVLFLIGGPEIEEPEILICHSQKLVLNSTVLAQSAPNWNPNKHWIITPEDPAPFILFIKMMYVDWDAREVEEILCGYGPLDMDLTPELVVEVLDLSCKYGSKTMFFACSRLISKFLNLSRRKPDGRMITVLMYKYLRNKQAICHPGQNPGPARYIFRRVKNFLLQDGQAVFYSNAIYLLDHSEMVEIVTDNMLMCQESTVVQACIRWAIYKCLENNTPVNDENLISCLGTMIYHLRIPHLLSDFFNDVERGGVRGFDFLHLLGRMIAWYHAGLFPRCSPRPRNKPNVFIMQRSEFEDHSGSMVDLSYHHGFEFKVSNEIQITSLTLGFFVQHDTNEGIMGNIRITMGTQEMLYSGPDIMYTIFSDKILLARVNWQTEIPAFTPVKIQFAIRGIDTYFVLEATPYISRDIGVWVDKSLIEIEFSTIPGVRNGLRVLPLVTFITPEL